MTLPDITHLQFFILGLLLDGERTGRQLREKLAEEGEDRTLAAFYQLMARLEDEKFVKGWYETKTVGSQPIKERRYRVTAAGARAYADVEDYYRNALASKRGRRTGFATN